MWEKGETSPRELCSYPFILREKGSGTRELCERDLEDGRLSLRGSWSCSN